MDLLGDRAAEAAARLVNHYVRSVREAYLTYGRPGIAPVDDTLPGVVPEIFGSSADAVAWYLEERHVLHQVCRLAVSLGDHRSAILLLLDWRPMSQIVDLRRDMLPFAELALPAVEHVEEPKLRAEAFRDVAATLARCGQRDRARTYYDLAASTFEQLGDGVGQANVFRNMAGTLAMDPVDRIEYLRRSVAIAREIGDQPILATSLSAFGTALGANGRFDDAVVALDEATSIIADIPALSWLRAVVMRHRSTALAGTGQLEESAAEATRALEVLRKEGDAMSERAAPSISRRHFDRARPHARGSRDLAPVPRPRP